MTPPGLADTLMSLRAKSWSLSKKEDDLLDQIHMAIMHRKFIDEEIDRIERDLMAWKKQQHPEPEARGSWGWMK